MSIPPLVCSTPPPPEQCDDDRDGEDFDIQYNLSQDDEDDGHNYNYGTYSDYIYPTSPSSNIHQDVWSSNISKKTDDDKSTDLLEENNDTISVLPKSDSSSVNKLVFEDMVLEDLNLKIEPQNDEATLEQNANKFDTESLVDCNKESSNEVTDDLDKRENSVQFAVVQDFSEAILVDNAIKTSEKNEEPLIKETVVDEYTQKSFDEDTIESNRSENKIANKIISDIIPNVDESTESNIPVIEQTNVIESEHKLEVLSDDSFGEFDDFQFISSENNPPASITYCDNPWESEVPKSSDFGSFTANFDVEDSNLCENSGHLEEEKANENTNVDPQIHATDDFGDFDDFKSSTNDYRETNEITNELSQNVPVLSLHSPESEVQIIESINSVLSSIFTSEILDSENDFKGNLESSLNETWGHLVDTDVRQSYIVNWNNSLGQKSLLKALCIDSRNILYGPKWNTNMPKYAANLTVAPLQPQKPVTPTNSRNADEQNMDKTTSKEANTWTDPFTSDGQEYTYAEALLLDLEHLMATLDQMAHKNSSFKISDLLTNACTSESESTPPISRPANLDVFTNVMSPEMGHIYSSTLTVQPIRQINLPDTHIFTPTNSETPRSKTIHYDQAPAVLVPQPSEGSRKLDELPSNSKSEVSVQNSENDEEYWEFQDFKGDNGAVSKNVTSSVNQVMNTTPTNNSSVPRIMSSYETQILQPIKVEPVTPALNWPDPGEVKETFDDFSEFISNTAWNNENINTSNQSDSRLNNKLESGTEILEDEFETFQSAPVLKNTLTPIDNTNQTTANVNHHNFNDFSPSFVDTSDVSHTANAKPDGIIFSKQSLVQNDSSPSGTDNLTIAKESNEKTSPALSTGNQSINTTIMQPSIVNTSASQRNHQKTGQILQPLSLESYSQINWPSPGIDLQDLSRFNPVESLQSLKTEFSTGTSSRLGSPAHKDMNTVRSEISDEDIWGEFVSSKPKQQQTQPKKLAAFADDDEWTDFVSSPSVKPQNGLNTISLNVHTNLNMQKTLGPNKFHTKNNQLSMDIPTLKYVTPKSSNRGLYNDKHFQNL